jgi:hypothetical protein
MMIIFNRIIIFGKNSKLNRAKQRDQKQLDKSIEEYQTVYTRNQHLLSRVGEKQIELLQESMISLRDEWLDIPDEVQDLYFKNRINEKIRSKINLN